MSGARWSLLITLTIAMAAAVVFAAGGSLVRADGGPHRGDAATGGRGGGLPNQCGACHRVRQGVSGFRRSDPARTYQLCLTCHNGAGSQLDVLDGLRLDTKDAADPAAAGGRMVSGFTLSVAPDATRHARAGGSVEYTIAVWNTGIESVTTTFTVSLSEAASSNFLPSNLSGITLILAGGRVGYVDLVVRAAPGAPNGAWLLTAVTATAENLQFGLQTATVTTQTTVGLPSDDRTLNGGGFMFVNGAPVTSRHNADPADNSSFPWGFSDSGSGQSANTGQNLNWMGSALQCTSCHNPHGSDNYRMLRDRLFGVTTAQVNVKAFYAGAITRDEGAPGLNAGAPADKYVGEYYASEGTGGAPNTGAGSLASLCVACHGAYPSNGAAVAYTAGGVTHYRHKTEMPFTAWANPESGRVSQNPETNPIAGFPALRLASNSGNDNTIVTCLTCHRAHGTSSTMEGYAVRASLGGLADEGLSPAQTGLSRSTLLFTANRGACQACHQWGVTP